MKQPNAKEEQDCRPKSVREEMRSMLDRDEELQEQMLMVIKEKALKGDLKTIEFILGILGERPEDKLKNAGPSEIRVEFAPEIGELAE